MSAAIRLLLVDDELPNLETFRRVYRKMYNIQVAESGSAGLELLNGKQFDVVVSDYGMPGMTGAEFVSRAKHTQPVAVVMVTGFMNHPEVQRLETSGEVFAVLGKPWEKDSIIDVIARASECTRTMRDAS
jgi:response regulator RpfG family c-di-GMP phosphodiesterase